MPHFLGSAVQRGVSSYRRSLRRRNDTAQPRAHLQRLASPPHAAGALRSEPLTAAAIAPLLAAPRRRLSEGAPRTGHGQLALTPAVSAAAPRPRCSAILRALLLLPTVLPISPSAVRPAQPRRRRGLYGRLEEGAS